MHIGTPREEKWITWLRPVIQGPESLKEKSLFFTLGNRSRKLAEFRSRVELATGWKICGGGGSLAEGEES